MTPLIRTLESWTAHQDYFWFLGLLTWLAVAYGAARREGTSGKRHPWLVLLAAMFALICGLEITLFALAANFAAPYLWWDFCLGLALSAAIGAMFQPVLDGLQPVARTGAALAIAVVLLGLAVWRWWSPQLAGSLLGLCAVAGVIALMRAEGGGILSADAARGERRLVRAWWAVLLTIPVLIDFGPISYWANNGRRFRDLSDFSLLSALLCLAAGMIGAILMWRRYARSAAWSDRARRELRAPVALLAVWLAVGYVLTVGSGWLARRNYEKDLIVRLRTAAAALDPEMLKVVLGPDLKLGPMSERLVVPLGMQKFTSYDRQPEPAQATTLSAAFIGRAPFEPLTAKLRDLDIINTDLHSFRLLVIRGGYLFGAVTVSDRPISIRQVTRPDGTVRNARIAYGLRIVSRPATIEDYVDLHTKRPLLEPPARGVYGSTLSLRVPLQPRGSRQPLGWLAAELNASIWRTTFTTARFQTMLMVAIGVALWATAIGYRLRRVEREQAERIAREAAAADRAKSEFLAHVSHELRTPIQSVLGYAELLASSKLGELGHQRLAALRSQGDLLLRLVNDLIDLGALQASVFRLQSGAIDPAALTRDCLETIRPQAETKHLTLGLELESGIPWIEADGQRLRQILLNLLTNAVKFTDTGSITLRMRRSAHAADMLEWTVQDTGPGIAREDQDRIFEPFVRLERDQAITGAGMGLALCARLCAAMKGAITVQSEGDTGTTFTVRLPLHARAPVTAITPPVAQSPSAWRGLRVLIADDNTLVRELLLAFFQEHGAEAAAVPDGLAAVELCASREFDVIVLDLSMPWLDGREASRRLRRPGATLGQPWIIGLSAHAGAEDADSALEAGMNRFLTKPVRLAELGAAVAEAPRARSRPRFAATLNAGSELTQRLTTRYLAETPAILTEMRAALEKEDRPLLRTRAHYLKNSADVLGAEDLRHACNVLYVNADSAGADRLAELLVTVETASHLPATPLDFSPDFPAQR
jgi:signal transduction histidine kinase/CheY-like chemotaxis protein